MTYRVSPELRKLIREDLPEDIEQVVDQVANSTEELADSLFNEFKNDVEASITQYQNSVESSLDNLRTALAGVEEEVIQINDQIANMQSMSVKVTEIVEQLKIANPRIDLDPLKTASNELNTKVNQQREKVQKISQSIGSLGGIALKTVLPFPKF